METSRTTRTFHCSDEIWKDFKLYCLKKDTSVSRELRRLMYITLKQGGIVETDKRN